MVPVTAIAQRRFRRPVMALLLLMFAQFGFGAVSANTVWEIRTTGNANNGGGFVTGATGTDFSQQNAAQCTATDLTLPSTTTATSATCPFGATSVGNIIQITAGTNCTTGFYQVVSVAGTTATLDRVAGTTGCTAGTFALGGALTLPSAPCATMIPGNTMWVKAGTYTVTTACTLAAGGSGVQTAFSGYTSTRGDGGKATWTTATNSTRLIAYNAIPYLGLSVEHFNFTNTAGTRSEAIGPSANTTIQPLYVNDCTFDGFSSAINIRGGNGNVIQNVSVTNSTASGIQAGSSNNATSASLYNVWVHNSATVGIILGGAGGSTFNLTNVVSSANTGDGIDITPQSGTANDAIVSLFNVVSANNGGSGVQATSATVRTALLVANSIFYGNTGNGIKFGAALPTFQFSVNNAFGSNTGGNLVNFNTGTAQVSLTANPFTNAGSGNFALNSTAGGGAALKGVGFPGTSVFGTGFADIGALQSQSTGGQQRVYGGSN